MKFRNLFFNFSVMLVLVLLYRTSEAKKGPTNIPSSKGDKAEHTSTGVLLVKHSQTTIVPQCSPGHVKLWEGYSLLSKDMGSTGSCVRKFSAIPFQPFHSNSAFGMEEVRFLRRDLNSFWLTTGLPNPASRIEGEEIIEYISRCAVCEVPKNVIALHSQTHNVPSCPSGWDLLWEGYSFVSYTPGNSDIRPGDLPAGPGSCLFDFHTIPVIECWGEPGRCKHPAGKLSYWLAVIGVDSRQRDARSSVSRCSVCSKN